MANTIKIKNSGTGNATPSALEYGELGLNYADGKLFYKNSSNNIVPIGTVSSMNYAQTQATKQTSISASGVTIVSTSITTKGYPVQVLVTGDAENGTAGGWIKLQLYRDSTPIGKIVHVESSAGSENIPYALNVIDTPTTGTYTYSLKTASTSAAGTFNFGETDGPVLTAVELAGATGSTGATGATGPTGATGAGGALGYWGSFWSTQDQTAAAIDTAYAITFNNSDASNSGVTLSNTSRINFTYAGVYSLIFSIQFANSDSQIHDANVWFRKNGTNLDASDTRFSVVSSHGGINGHAVGTVNLVLSVSAGDYIELFWQTNDTHITLEYIPAASPAPSIPSVIFTATQVMYTQLPTVTTNAQTASYTLVLGDAGKMIEMNVGTANNLTVPADNTVNFPVGTSIDILQVGAGQTTIVASSGVTINRSTGLKTRLQWSAATLIKRSANTWVAIGDLSA